MREPITDNLPRIVAMRPVPLAVRYALGVPVDRHHYIVPGTFLMTNEERLAYHRVISKSGQAARMVSGEPQRYTASNRKQRRRAK